MKYSYQGHELFPEVEIYHDAIPFLAGITMREFYVDYNKCAWAWKEANAILRDTFRDLLPLRKPGPASTSYGHLVCLGAQQTITEHGEPNIKPFAGSIDEAVAILKDRRGMDFQTNEGFRFTYESWQYMRSQFPEEDIPFSGFNPQGPLTSAVLMRGQDFLMDIYDEPEKSKEFLRLMVDSIIEYKRLIFRINGQPEVQKSGGFADDFAALIPPKLWHEFVIPHLNQLYEGFVSGPRRSLHLENLAPQHLPLLKELKLTHFQPSVSPYLTLENVKANLDPSIPFDWLLYAYHVIDMTDRQIQEWVDRTVQAGVAIVRTQFGTHACRVGKLDRIKAFIHAFDKYSQA